MREEVEWGVGLGGKKKEMIGGKKKKKEIRENNII